MKEVTAKHESGKKTYVFRVVVEPDEGRWHAYCPALEEYAASTWGYTEEEAFGNIEEVIQMTIEELIENQAKWTEEYLKRLKILK